MTFDPTTAVRESFDPSTAVRESFDPSTAVREDEHDTRTVLSVAVKQNPDQAAKAAKLGKEYGAPADVLLRTITEAETIDRVNKATERLKTSPKLEAAMRAKPFLAAQAHDDIETLSALEQSVQRTAGDIAGDIAVTAFKGAVGLPQAFVGLADIVTGGYAGKVIEASGIRFADAQQVLDTFYSPAQQRANESVREAQGFVDTLRAMLTNPSTIATTVGESAPQMIGGAAIGRGVVKLLPKVAPWLAAAIGEGALSAGAAAEQMREEDESGLLGVKQTFAAVMSGVGTTLFGVAGGRAAQRLGLDDIDTALVKGGATPEAAKRLRDGFAAAIAKASISEGVFEELPQSVQEQMWQNWANNRPIGEGVGAAAAQGLLAGMSMGGGFQAVQRVADAMERANNGGEAADKFSENIKEQLRTAGQSTLRERNPEAFREAVGQMDAGKVYVDGEVLNQLAPEVQALLPESVREQIAEAAETGGAVEIELADLLTQAPGTALEQVVIEHGKADPFALSAAEAQMAKTMSEEQATRQYEEALAKAEDKVAFEQSYEEVRQTFVQQLNETGRYRPAVSDAMGHFIASFYATRAADRGMLPGAYMADLAQRMGAQYRVVGGPTARGGVVEQGGGLAEWFGKPGPDNNLVNEDGTPMVLFHGTSEATAKAIASGEPFKRSKTGAMGAAVYLGGSQDVAEAYNAGAIVRVFARGKYLSNAKWTEYVNKHGWAKAEDAARADGYAGVRDTMFENAVAVWDPANILVERQPLNQTATSLPPTIEIDGKQAANERDLMVTHNLTAANLLHADKMGGLPVPSLAVTKKNTPLTGFGEITLIGPPEMADPKGYAGTKVFGADIYSPRYPSVERDIDRKAWVALRKALEPMAERMGVGLPDISDLERNRAEEFERDPLFMGAFLKARGVEPNIVMRKGYLDDARRTRLEQSGLGPWLESTSSFAMLDDPEFVRLAAEEAAAAYRDTGDERMIARADKLVNDPVTAKNLARDLANRIAADAKQRARPEADKYETQKALETQIDEADLRAQFQKYVADQLASVTKGERIPQGYTNSGNRKYIPHTLENVVKILKKELRGGESFNYGVGSVRAKFTPQFKSVAQIKKEKGRLVTAEQFDAIKDEINSEFVNMAEAMKIRTETLSAIMEDGATQGLVRAAKTYSVDLDEGRAEQIAEFMDKLRNLPTAYFEAKILRDVSLSEFEGAVVPENTDPKVLDALRKAGVTDVRTYKAGDEAARAAAIQGFSDLFFQGQSQGPLGTFNPSALESVLNPNANLSTFFHETGHFFLEALVFEASQPDALAREVDMANTVMAWFGTDMAAWKGMTLEQKRAYHERFAESIEQYIMEGKAPSRELAPLFRRYAAWLLNVYKSIKAMLAGRGVTTSGTPGALDQAAYHGTPHRGIEKFSTDKIGTGEGAQAYGWGLYFASKREIAEWYRKNLAEETFFVGGQRMDEDNPAHVAAATLAFNDSDRAAAIQTLRAEAATQYSADKRTVWNQAADVLERGDTLPEVTREQGQLYEVDIPEDDTMLLWDKPLSEQPEMVRKAVSRVFKKYVEPTVETYWTLDGERLDTNSPDFGLVQKIASQGYEAVMADAKSRVDSRASRPENDPLRKAAGAVLARVKALRGRGVEQITRTLEVVESDVTGQALYRGMERTTGSDKAASEALAALGIKGIKYLDGTSRGAGDGSFNYVIFSGDDVAITNQFYQGGPNQPSQIQLNDDVRRVFDKLLATDEQIAQANEVAGLTPDADADAQANERLRKRSMADLKWAVRARDEAIKKLRKEAAEIEKGIRAEVTAEVEQMPEVRAKAKLSELRKAKQLDDQTRATVVDSFPEAGWDSVDAMLQAIDAFGKKQDVIDGLTEKRMLEEHGDLIDDRAIAEAANEAVHNEARARSLASELRTQREMLNPRRDTGETTASGARVTVNALVEAAKQFGAKVADRTVLRDIRSRTWQHTAAERRAGKAWQEATAAGKTAEAVKAKQDQMFQNAAAKALLEAKAEAQKVLDFFKRVTQGNDETVVEKGRDADIVNAARAVLAAYGVQTPASKSAKDYLELVKRNDPETYNVIAPMVEAASNNAQPLESLTFAELMGLHEDIQAMWDLAKSSREMEKDGKRVLIQDGVDALHARMEEVGVPDTIPGEAGALTDADKARRWVQYTGAALRRVEQWTEKMDGKFGGAFREWIFQPIKDAAVRYQVDRIKYRKRFQELVDAVAPSMTAKLIAAPELGYTFGKGHNGIGHAELLHAILHTGNGSNKRKLLLAPRKDGVSWGEQNPDGTLNTSKWDAFIERMHREGVLTKAHWDFAQGVWDLLEETKPLAQKAHRDVFGRYFAEVTAEPVATPFGQYRGGYVPAQADPVLTTDASIRELAEMENQNMAYSFPTTSKGFTKGRVEYNRPLKLDLRTIPQHLDKVLLFSHMEPAVRGVTKLLRQKGVSQPLGRIDPSAYDGMLLPWLNRSARQIVETPIAGDGGVSRIASVLRARAGAALMFANISNALQQVTGFTGAMVKVKGTRVLAGIAQMTAHPKQTRDAVKALSPYMSTRMDSEISAMTDAVNDILLKPSLYENAQRWSQRHAYFLQTAMANYMEPAIWIGAYNQAIEEGMEERMAVRFADGVIRQTQGANAPEDVSRFETGPAAARLFTQFVGYFNMIANTNATALQQIAQEMGVKRGAGKMLGVVFFGLLAPIWTAELIAQAFRGGPGDDDEDGEYLDDWLAAVFGFGTIKGMLAMVPGVAQLGQVVVNRFNDNPADDRFSLSPAVSLLESAASVPKDIYDATQDKLNAQKLVRDSAALVSIATGLPATAVARPLGYLAGVATDRIEPTGPVDAARGVVTGTASPESKAQ